VGRSQHLDVNMFDAKFDGVLMLSGFNVDQLGQSGYTTFGIGIKRPLKCHFSGRISPLGYQVFHGHSAISP